MSRIKEITKVQELVEKQLVPAGVKAVRLRQQTKSKWALVPDGQKYGLTFNHFAGMHKPLKHILTKAGIKLLATEPAAAPAVQDDVEETGDYRLPCPKCQTILTLDKVTRLGSRASCPNCGAALKLASANAAGRVKLAGTDEQSGNKQHGKQVLGPVESPDPNAHVTGVAVFWRRINAAKPGDLGQGTPIAQVTLSDGRVVELQPGQACAF